MKWSEVEKKYGKELARKMGKSPYMLGITVTMGKDGKADIPESDIERAYRDVTKGNVQSWEID